MYIAKFKNPNVQDANIFGKNELHEVLAISSDKSFYRQVALKANWSTAAHPDFLPDKMEWVSPKFYKNDQPITNFKFMWVEYKELIIFEKGHTNETFLEILYDDESSLIGLI
jgi:hypothetical protein